MELLITPLAVLMIFFAVVYLAAPYTEDKKNDEE